MTRIAVTTTPDAAGRFEAALAAAGLVPVSLPSIAVTPADSETLVAVREAASTADWVVLTSRRAVETVWPLGGLPAAPAVAAVGEATAAAAADAGGRLALVGTGGASEVRLLLDPLVGGTRVVFPHAAGADPGMRRFLEERAAWILAAAVYQTISIAPGGDAVDGVVFGSPSAVDGWLLSRELQGMLVAAIGPTTAAHLEARGFVPQVVAPRADPESVAAAVLASTHLKRLEAK